MDPRALRAILFFKVNCISKAKLSANNYNLIFLPFRVIFTTTTECHLGESLFKGGGDGAVDEEVGGEVEHDEQVGDALQAHDPPGRDVLVQQLHARHLHICNILIVIASVQCHCQLEL